MRSNRILRLITLKDVSLRDLFPQSDSLTSRFLVADDPDDTTVAKETTAVIRSATCLATRLRSQLIPSSFRHQVISPLKQVEQHLSQRRVKDKERREEERKKQEAKREEERKKQEEKRNPKE